MSRRLEEFLCGFSWWEEMAGVLCAREDERTSIDLGRSCAATNIWRVESPVRGLYEMVMLLVEDFRRVSSQALPLEGPIVCV